jgi:hypothetical protein
VNVRVHIDRLVLDGFALGAGDGARVGAAMQAELARLLAERGLSSRLAGGGAVGGLQGAALRPDGSSSPAALGRGIAQSVHGAVGPDAR